MVPISGEASYTQIASGTGLPEVNVRRLIRHAILQHIFYEPRPGYVAHTRASRLMAEDQALQDWVGFHVEDCFQAASHTIDSLVKYPGSGEPTQAGFQIAEGTEGPYWVAIGKIPKRAKRFGGAMGSYAGEEGFQVSYLVENYPWDKFGNGTVVDVCSANP